MTEKKELNCWQRAEEQTFKILLFSKLVLGLLIMLIMWIIYAYQFFAPRTTENVAQFFTVIFLTLFVLVLLINLLTVICRYRRKGELCTRTNCSFILVTLTVMAVTVGVGS